jgi:opacity protein-like surface antigen
MEQNMKPRLIPGLAMIATTFTATPALAAYHGFYFGFESGYESNGSSAESIMLVQPGPVGSLNQERSGGTGWALGVFTGYAFELTERWFVSLEGSISMSDADIKFTDLDGEGAPIEDQGVRVVMQESIAISGQIGYMLSDRLAVYGRLGLPGAKIAYKSLEPNSSSISSRSSYFTSYQAGAGLQYALGRHLFTRLEYTYSDLTVGAFKALDGRHRVMLGLGMGY